MTGDRQQVRQSSSVTFSRFSCAENITPACSLDLGRNSRVSLSLSLSPSPPSNHHPPSFSTIIICGSLSIDRVHHSILLHNDVAWRGISLPIVHSRVSSRPCIWTKSQSTRHENIGRLAWLLSFHIRQLATLRLLWSAHAVRACRSPPWSAAGPPTRYPPYRSSRFLTRHACARLLADSPTRLRFKALENGESRALITRMAPPPRMVIAMATATPTAAAAMAAAISITTRLPMPRPAHRRDDSVMASRPLSQHKHLQLLASAGAIYSTLLPLLLRPNTAHSSPDPSATPLPLRRPSRLHSRLLPPLPASRPGLLRMQTFLAPPPTDPLADVARLRSRPRRRTRPILQLTAVVDTRLAATTTLPAPTMNPSIGMSVASGPVTTVLALYHPIITCPNRQAARDTPTAIKYQPQPPSQQPGGLRLPLLHLWPHQAWSVTGAPLLDLPPTPMAGGGLPARTHSKFPRIRRPIHTPLLDQHIDPIASRSSRAPSEQRDHSPLLARLMLQCHLALGRHPLLHQSQGEAVRRKRLLAQGLLVATAQQQQQQHRPRARVALKQHDLLQHQMRQACRGTAQHTRRYPRHHPVAALRLTGDVFASTLR